MITLYDLDGEFLARFSHIETAIPFTYEQAETVGSAEWTSDGGAPDWTDMSAHLGAEIADRAADDGRDAWEIGCWPLVRAAVAAGLANPDDLVMNHEMASWEALNEALAAEAGMRRAWL